MDLTKSHWLVVALLFSIPPAFALDQAQPDEWRYYGGGASNTRYAPLDLINKDNVSELEIAWRWQSANFGPRPEFNYRATPLLVDGVLYITAGIRRAVAAIDATTGETLWMYRMDEGERGDNAPRINSGRGVAYWQGPEGGRILYITPGYQLVALDAATGKPVPSFGKKGIVDLKRGLDREADLLNDPIGSSSPPIVVGDVVVVGSAFPFGGAPPTKEMLAGHVRGFDLHTGERKWIFHTVPMESEVGYETWGEGSANYTGNTGVWTTMSADLERGYVYLPLEASTGDFYGGHRPGDNLFSQTLVCLDAKTGRRVWHFQTVHHGIWDYDLPAAPLLADITVDGRKISALAQLTKQGFVFVLDRYTGEPVWPIEERPAPPSDVPGEAVSPTQPYPTLPAPFVRQGIGADDLIDFTPKLKAEALAILKQYRHGPLYTPPSIALEEGTQGTLMLPTSLGGANWPGGALDPETGLLYIPTGTQVGISSLGHEPDVSNMRYVMNAIPAFVNGAGPHGLPLVKPPWGQITAIDLNTGLHRWSIPNGDVPDYVKNHPALAGVELPRTGRPDRGGLLVTKTLLFAGEGSGLYATVGGGGPMLRAHDKQTGEIVAEYELPANQSGLPMSYAIDGQQYIVLAIGAKNHPAELIALTVP